MKPYWPIAVAVALLVAPALVRDGLGVHGAAAPDAAYTRVAGTSAYPITQAAMKGLSDYCEDDSLDVAGIPIDEMQQLAHPTDEQRTALDELDSASVEAAQIVKASCPTGVPPTPVGRIDGVQQRVQAMLKALTMVGPPLAKFYNMLTDEQKARLNVLTQKQPAPANDGGAVAANGSHVASCRNRVIPEWPTAQISRDVRPSPMQQTLLNALQGAGAKARDILEASCQTDMPVTPSGRLSLIEQRLHSILAAIGTVRGPLNDFYGSLTDEQKSHFNIISRSRASKHD
jgi:hypothetical protein